MLMPSTMTAFRFHGHRRISGRDLSTGNQSWVTFHLQEYGYEVSIIRRQCNTLTRRKLAEEAPIGNTCHSRSSGGPPLIAMLKHSTCNRASAQRCFVVPSSKSCHRGAQKVVRESSKGFRGWSIEFWFHVHYQRLSFQVFVA